MTQKPAENLTQPAGTAVHSSQADADKSSNAQQTSSMADQVKNKWHELIGSAKTTWGKLSNDELLKSEGQAEKLGALVQQRYSISRKDADEQVKHFMDKCKC
jgi:uncharacterized protein YjbJ (UPF0337 family)